jgi:hypothetical protein
MNDLIYKLPVSLKLRIGNLTTVFNFSKRESINRIDELRSVDFKEINSLDYKRKLRSFFSSSLWSAKEISEYLDYLYNDKINLYHEGTLSYKYPIIIGVIKNEADKLVNFFNHYKKLGRFNYVFIDNGSTDQSKEIVIDNGGTVYQCLEPFSTHRKLSWINKVYSTFPNNVWTLLLDADELLVYDGYEEGLIDKVLSRFDEKNIDLAGAVMIDMFSNKRTSRQNYLQKYIYFENNFHEEKSVYCNSVYGGIRERAFRFNNARMFLIKKHPVIKKNGDTLLMHCHYIYPFKRNYESQIYFGLLHYKLFDSEIDKFKRISTEESYGNGSIEYKNYYKVLAKKTYEEIFAISETTEMYVGTESLKKIQCIKDVRKLSYEKKDK